MIKDLAELKKLLALCRKQGVKEIKCGEISVVLGDLPRAGGDDEEEEKPMGLTDEQLTYFSVGGGPIP